MYAVILRNRAQRRTRGRIKGGYLYKNVTFCTEADANDSLSNRLLRSICLGEHIMASVQSKGALNRQVTLPIVP